MTGRRSRSGRSSGNLWVAENVITYDGKPTHTVNILETRDGKVTHETIYFGDPWRPPAWRAHWVELYEPASARIQRELADTP